MYATAPATSAPAAAQCKVSKADVPDGLFVRPIMAAEEVCSEEFVETAAPKTTAGDKLPDELYTEESVDNKPPPAGGEPQIIRRHSASRHHSVSSVASRSSSINGVGGRRSTLLGGRRARIHEDDPPALDAAATAPAVGKTLAERRATHDDWQTVLAKILEAMERSELLGALSGTLREEIADCMRERRFESGDEVVGAGVVMNAFFVVERAVQGPKRPRASSLHLP